MRNLQQEFSFTRWLRTRFLYDAKARSKKVEKTLLDYFSDKSCIRILDLGSGLGANTQYYAPLFPSSQDWTLLEIDRKLAETSLWDLRTWASRGTWNVNSFTDHLVIRTGERTISVYTKNTSFFELNTPGSLADQDLIMSNAFFDLIPQDKFTRFASILSSAQKPLLSTLNYVSMHFTPKEKADKDYISLYESHMLRPKEFGRPMGFRCGEKMKKTLSRGGYTVHSDQSLWEISPRDEEMMDFIFWFLDEAIGEMIPGSQEKEKMKHWKKSKLLLLEKNHLHLTVKHLDYFAHPKV